MFIFTFIIITENAELITKNQTKKKEYKSNEKLFEKRKIDAFALFETKIYD